MSAIASTPIDPAAKNAPTSGRLFFLDLSGGRILSANPDGSDLKTIVNEGRKLPDGVALDVAAGHIYWTNMGDPNRNDGSIIRSDLNGKNMITIVPPGGTFTPKQLQLEKRSRKLYWSDREGMRVMRANLDGSEMETLVDTSLGDSRPGSDQRKWCVGIAVDTDGGKFYWTQKGGHDAGLGRIFRANIQVPQGQSAGNRSDIELLYDNLPEPIDLDLDPVNRTLYWTDRGDPPRGNTVNRAPMDPEAKNGKEPEILFTHLMEALGLALDLKGGRMFITDFGGSVYSANLDGSNRREVADCRRKPQRHCIRGSAVRILSYNAVISRAFGGQPKGLTRDDVLHKRCSRRLTEEVLFMSAPERLGNQAEQLQHARTPAD